MKKDYNSALDYIIEKLIEENIENPFIGFNDEYNALKDKITNALLVKYKLNHLEVRSLFGQLITDGYINPYLTLSGKWLTFVKKGGYVKEEANAQLVRYATISQAIALIIFSGMGAWWAFLQIHDRLSACCACHH